MSRRPLFVTGASGFVGARLLSQLDPDAHTGVVLLVRRGELTLPERLRGRVEVVRADLHDRAGYAPHMAQDATVLHLAALTGSARRTEHFHVNDAGTGELVAAAAERQAGRVLFLSSIACSFAKRAGYHYADAKEAGERRIARSGLPWAVVRSTIVLGIGSAIWTALSTMAAKPRIVLPGSGRVRIQPIWVDDLVRMLLNEVAECRLRDEVVEFGGPDVLTFDDFLTRASRRLRGTPSTMVHVPGRPIVWALQALEAALPVSLPVRAGQLASFLNDGVARPDARLDSLHRDMLGVDAMLERLVSPETPGAGGVSPHKRNHAAFTRRTV